MSSVIGSSSSEEVRTGKPEWYVALMKQSFHEVCRTHQKHLVDFFCFYCHRVGCCKCYTLHPLDHSIVQVFDMFEHDTVWLDSISDFVDCSGIQNHGCEGSTRVVLKPKRKVTYMEICRNLVPKPSEFCSVACKVNHLFWYGEDPIQLFKIYTPMLKTKRPSQDLTLSLSLGQNDKNALVEQCCSKRPRCESTSSQGPTLPPAAAAAAVEYYDRTDLFERCATAIVSRHVQLPAEQNDQNAPGRV